MNKEEKKLSKEVEDVFSKYSWPGNIRELENIIEHGMCFSKSNYIELEDLPDYFTESLDINTPIKKNSRTNISQSESLEDLTIEYERRIIKELLLEFGNTTEAKKIVAEKLNIGLTTLYRKVNNYHN